MGLDLKINLRFKFFICMKKNKIKNNVIKNRVIISSLAISGTVQHSSLTHSSEGYSRCNILRLPVLILNSGLHTGYEPLISQLL